MSLAVDAQPISKNAMNKTRMPISAVCLITEHNLCAAHLRCNQPQGIPVTDRPTVSTTGVPIQKCPELIPDSPAGAYDGLAKCAAVDVMWSPVCSVMTPSSCDEAQAESSHATNNTKIPHHAACLFTKPNLLIAERHATSGTRALVLRQGAAKKFCAERKARV